jgi:hypothetical protein
MKEVWRLLELQVHFYPVLPIHSTVTPLPALRYSEAQPYEGQPEVFYYGFHLLQANTSDENNIESWY